MKVVYLPDGTTVNACYRSIAPMLTLAGRGHETRRLDLDNPGTWDAALQWCDVLHLHRVCDRGVVDLAQAARSHGAAVVWDDDDDVTRVPRASSGYREAGGLKGVARLSARARLFEHVDLVTTPSRHLADAFLDGGASDALVVENYVVDRYLQPREPSDALTIGWVAGEEHRLDLERIPVVSALERLLAAHPDVRVVTVGVSLGLASTRYRHVKHVDFKELSPALSSLSVGIAPLSADIAINRARSNIKLKEYAANGVPWLASPIGPYETMRDKDGGRLVADDGWFDALDALVRSTRIRRRLAKRAARWGRSQWLTNNIGQWEDALARAIQGRRA